MQFDPQNKIVKLCGEGMALEAQGKKPEARAMFQQAWNLATDDFEAFTAAHFLARAQQTPEQQLFWNQEALKRAVLVHEPGMRGHYPSLYLNLGKSYEDLGKTDEAIAHYRLALAYSSELPAGPYGDMIRSGISEGLRRMGIKAYASPELDELIDVWCERKELKPLSFLLPAYVGNLGSEADLNKLSSALSYLSATNCLNKDDQQVIQQLIERLTRQKK